MLYKLALQLLTLALVTSLAGCATTRPGPVVAPCPALPTPPPGLIAPAESKATAERLMQLLPNTSPPAPGTPNG